jgi:hypothetical protein
VSEGNYVLCCYSDHSGDLIYFEKWSKQKNGSLVVMCCYEIESAKRFSSAKKAMNHKAYQSKDFRFSAIHIGKLEVDDD